MIFLSMPSKRSNFADAGWPSIKPSGLTKDTPGSVPLSPAARKSVQCWMCAALCGVAHNGRRIGFKVADVAVRPADLHSRIGIAGIMLKGYSGVICTAVIRPGNSFFVERVANSTDISWGNGTTACDALVVHGAV